MKLRMRGDSLRLRLTQAEISTLTEVGRVEESVAFGEEPDARFTYAIMLSPSVTEVRARLLPSRVEVTMPAALGHAWCASERVGVEAEQSAGPGSTLRILVEKDFACLKPRAGEDDDGAFPNPAAR